MIAKKSNKIVLLLIIALTLLCSSLFCGLNFSTAHALDAGQKNDFFQVELLSSQNKSLSSASVINYQYSSINSANALVYNVKDTYNFKLHFDFSDSKTTSWGGAPSVSSAGYQLTVQVEYLKGYSSAYFTDDNQDLIDAVTVYNLTTQTKTQTQGYKDFSTYSPTINIQSSDSKGNTIINWGIYRFKMSLNDIVAYSDFFILQPTLAVDNKPKFQMYDNGIDEYIFSVYLTEEYKYVDENQIKWYVYGKTNSGENYALLESDLNMAKFINLDCNTFLYKSIDRTGYTFSLQKPDLKDGEWTVWCEYSPYGSTSIISSEEGYFTIGNTGSVMIFIWIAVGICVLGIGVTIVIVLIKVKHEKIY